MQKRRSLVKIILFLVIGLMASIAGIRLTFLVNGYGFPFFGLIYLISGIILVFSGVRDFISDKPQLALQRGITKTALIVLIIIFAAITLFLLLFALSWRGSQVGV